ncbi:cytochrome P450 6k1-like [Leptidea sinapis]|uniref:cytochrome P450 6k1-like n=1 Tax=Leptidea sinapis TaxID=189913 RepID=UPI002136319A|nr:cytochrome P450 6k1-like [Leptidea sinapis]
MLTLQSILCCIVVILLLTLYYFIQRQYSFWRTQGVVYERPWFPFGNLGFLMRKSFPEFFHELSIKYKCDYVGIFMGWKPTLVIQSPELAQQILVQDYHYFRDRHLYSGYSDPIGAYNLFTLKGQLWRDMRNELTPIFTSSKLRSITEWCNLSATELVMKIQRDHIEGNKAVNTRELFAMYISDNIAFTVFGIRESALNGEDSPMWQLTQHIVTWNFWRGLEFFLIFFLPGIASLFRLKVFSEQGSQYIKKMFWNVVDERRRRGFKDSKDLVNILLQLRGKYNDESNPEFADDLMIAQAAVFILGAVDTSSTVLSYCLHELSHHPDVQEKLFREIEAAMHKKQEKVLDYVALLELKYLTACINETMRKDTPIAELDRICIEDYKLNDDLVITKGTPVLVNTLAIHHNEKYYPEPNEWRPERFYGKVHSNQHFLAFGDGQRNCIGKRYAYMQMRAALVQIIYNYKVLPGMPYEVKSHPYSITLAPYNGGIVKFVLRSEN